jgi:ribosomal protein L3
MAGHMGDKLRTMLNLEIVCHFCWS